MKQNELKVAVAKAVAAVEGKEFASDALKEAAIKAAVLSTSAQYAQEIGREKMARVCAWLFRWGYCDRNIIALVAGDDLKYGSRLAKKGLLLKVENPKGGRSMYVLSQAGVDLAVNCLVEFLEIRCANTEYKYLVKRELPWCMTGHDNLVQEAMIRLGFHLSPIGTNWYSGNELANGTHGSKPDAQFNIDESKVWIEVETSGKNRESRCLQMWQRMNSMDKGKFTKLLWIFPNAGRILEVKRELEKDVCIAAYKDTKSHITLVPEEYQPMWRLKQISVLKRRGCSR